MGLIIGIIVFLIWIYFLFFHYAITHKGECPKGKGYFKLHDWRSNYYNKGYFFKAQGYTIWQSEDNTITCQNCYKKEKL